MLSYCIFLAGLGNIRWLYGNFSSPTSPPPENLTCFRNQKFGPLVLSPVSSLECYTCQGIEPLDLKCDGKKLPCHSSQTRCAKEYYVLGNTKTYAKSCTTEQLCDEKFFCGTATHKKDCEVHCCDTDLCNLGSTKMISTIAICTCALGALLNTIPF